MVENTHTVTCKDWRSDLIEGTGANIDVKSLLTSWLVRKRVWSSTLFAMDVAGLSDFKRQCGKDYVGESLNKAVCCRVSVRIQSEMESRWKAEGVFMEKLDVPDEVIVGVAQMRIPGDIVCYSVAISDCVKEPNSLMALALLKKTDQCSMFKDLIVFNPTISACGKRHALDHGITFAVSYARHRTAQEWLLLQRGDHSIWESLSLNIALKPLNDEKEHDGNVSNAIMDNTK